MKSTRFQTRMSVKPERERKRPQQKQQKTKRKRHHWTIWYVYNKINIFFVLQEKFTQIMHMLHECGQCLQYQKENRILRNKLISSNQLLSQKKATVAQLESSM